MRDALGALLLCVVAAGTFGVGLGIGMAMPVSGLLLFPRMDRRARLVLVAALVVLPLTYVAGFYAYSLVGTRQLAPNSGSLLGMLPTAIELTVRLVGHGFAGLLAGFTTTERLTTPVAVAAAGSLAVAVAVALWAADAASRRRLLACVLLPLAIYGITGVGRAPNVGFAGGVERIMTTPRYHYAGPLALALVAALLCIDTCWERSIERPRPCRPSSCRTSNSTASARCSS